MDIYFILWVIIQYMIVYFVAQIVALAIEVGVCPFNMPCPCKFFSLAFCPKCYSRMAIDIL